MLVIYLFQGLPGLPGRAGFTGTKGDYVSASFGCLFLECRINYFVLISRLHGFFRLVQGEKGNQGSAGEPGRDGEPVSYASCL